MIRLLRQWWNQRYPEWVAEVALRYLPVADHIRHDPEGGAILEVGGNNFGLTPYLSVPVVSADLQFSNRRSPFVKPVRARGQALPFKSRSFQLAVCLDTIEHVPAAERRAFASELIRVTSRRIYLGGPMGHRSGEQDQILNAYYCRKRGTAHGFLEEHIAHGLPTAPSLIGVIHASADSQGRRIRVQAWPNQNLAISRALIALWIRPDRVSYVLHRLAVLVVHLRRWLNFGSCYRQIVVVEFEDRRDNSGGLATERT